MREKRQENEQCTNKCKHFLGRTGLGRFVTGVKRGFEGKENIQGRTEQLSGKWAENISSPCGKRCWTFAGKQKLKQRNFCFQAVPKELCQLLAIFCGKGFGKCLVRRGERAKESRGAGFQSHSWGSSEEQQVTPGGVSSVTFVPHGLGVFPQLFYLWSTEIVWIPLFLNF